MKLYVLPPSPRALKVIALKNYLGLECEMHLVDLGKGDQFAPEYIAMNPNQKMPVLDDNGFVLWESNAILFYCCEKAGDQFVAAGPEAAGRRSPLAVMGKRTLGFRSVRRRRLRENFEDCARIGSGRIGLCGSRRAEF